VKEDGREKEKESIQGIPIQAYVAHVLFYFVILATFYAMRSLGGLTQANKGNLLFLLFLLDMFMIFILDWKGIYMMFSGFTLLLLVYYMHFHLIPKKLKKYMYIMIGLLVLLTSFVVNEALFCEKMQKKYPFPYHVIVEILGIILFWILSHFYWMWGKERT